MNLLLWTTHLEEKHLPLLKRIKDFGFEGVEVPLFEGDTDHFRSMRNILDDIGLGCSTVTVMDEESNPASCDATIRQGALDKLKWAVEMSNALGADILCGPLHSALGYFSGAGPTDDELKHSSDTLREAGKAAENAGVKLALEYLNRFECYLLTTAAGLAGYVDMVGHSAVGAMFDSFHAHIEEKDTAAAIKTLGSRIVHVHVSENDRGVPGTGQVAWESFFGALKEIEYSGWLTIEAFSRSLPDLAAATKVWRDLSPSLD